MSGVCMARATCGISFLLYCILHTGKVTHSGPFSKHGKLLGFCPRSVRGRHGLSAVRVPEDSRHTAIFPHTYVTQRTSLRKEQKERSSVPAKSKFYSKLQDEGPRIV